PEDRGTKAAAHYGFAGVPSGTSVQLRLRLCATAPPSGQLLDGTFDRQVAQRRQEADEFYRTVIPQNIAADRQNVMRQAFAGLLWSKQFYHYDVSRWLQGDPAGPQPPRRRLHGRNKEWRHLYNADVI